MGIKIHILTFTIIAEPHGKCNKRLQFYDNACDKKAAPDRHALGAA